MSSLFTIVLPVFAIIGLGYLGERRRWLDSDASAALSQFVFKIALPPLLFLAMARTPWDALAQWRFLAGYLLGTLTVFAIAWWVLKTHLSNPQQRWVACLAATFSNSVYLGIPLFETAFGVLSAQPVILIALMTNILLVGGSLVALQMMSGEGVSSTIKETLTNPMLLAIAAGIGVSAFGFPISAALDQLLSLLGQAASPVALFALGMTLGKSSESVVSGSTQWIIVGLKLLIHPLLVWVACVYVFGADAFNTQAAVLIAAIPAGAMVHVVATRRGVFVRESAAIILLSTLIAMMTLSAVLEWMV